LFDVQMKTGKEQQEEHPVLVETYKRLEIL
jgi:hypothetical protein